MLKKLLKYTQNKKEKERAAMSNMFICLVVVNLCMKIKIKKKIKKDY